MESIQGVSPFMKTNAIDNSKKVSPSEAQENFASTLKNSINELNKLETESTQMTDKMIRGEDVDLHQVLIASQKANVSMQFAMEVRNKVVEAYQEIMRMQM
ncbi:flagellar hook-basal body complex protein FliE [Bacillus kandeliae]|uniref:flagellar hook-basal body complex protein FliE n=1 Tax=Bacillus kandeliae TaxID=3129297 RepID=UPI0039B72A34